MLNLKGPARFLFRFALFLALALVLWPPVSWVYGPFLGAVANAFFALLRSGVRAEVGDRACLVYGLWPEVIRCEVLDFGAIYLNALVAAALFAALPGAWRGRLKALGVLLVALFASHLLSLYLLSQVALCNALSGPAPQASLRVLAFDKLYALWGAYGWEGLPFLAGALAFGKHRGLFRTKGRSARPRMRMAQPPLARTPRGLRAPLRPPQRRPHLALR